MKKSISTTLKLISSCIILMFLTSSCVTETIIAMEDEAADPILGKWFLVRVNTTDVTNIECYNTSFIESDAKNITFFIQDRLENGNCDIVFDNSQALTIQDDFYYLGDEVIDIYVDGNVLTWRVDLQTTLEFKK